jgi:NTP pyrophosphatase (non-canonical NTP hydrolase)
MIYGDMSLQSLMDLATEISDGIARENFDIPDLASHQALHLAEEVGEFVGALNRWQGRSRRSGTFEEMAYELADVVVTAFMTAVVLNIDLPEAIKEKSKIILSRGYREPTNVTIRPAIETSEASNAE